MMDELRARRRTELLFAVTLLAVALLYHLLFLRTFTHWWFEDDPSLFAFVKRIGNPLRFFFDRATMRQFAHGFLPMQALSIWLDSAIAYRNVRFAQIHSLLVLQVTLLLLFRLLRNIGLTNGSAFALATIWLFVPSVIVVNEFLSARHYLEGFAWSLGALLLAQKIRNRSDKPALPSVTALFALLLAAAFSKEIYAITIPVAVFFQLYPRRRAVAWSALSIPLVYVVARIWASGTSAFYDAPFLRPGGYLQFLWRLPFIITGNVAGYAVVAVLIVLLIYIWWRDRLTAPLLLCFAACLVTALIVIFPVTFPLSRDWREHGTWYRAAFLIATGAVLAFGYVLARLKSATLRWALLVFLAAAVVPGGIVTQKKWQIAMQRYGYEGKYYLSHPERLIYSEVPAFWFLPGIDLMYALKSHHVTAVQHTLPPDAASYQLIWRFRGGKFVEDHALFEELLANDPAR